MKRFTWLILLVPALLFGAASAQGLERMMTITMGEMFFQQEGMGQNEAITLETGVPYRITFTNVGTMVHRVKFGRGLIVEEGVPFAYSENLFTNLTVKILGVDELDGVRVITDELIELDLDAGKSVEVIFTLPLSAQGSWELGCFVIGHYEAGMRAPLNVE
jgi:uncharacterized cupredoxin-like copper-binding protein